MEQATPSPTTWKPREPRQRPKLRRRAQTARPTTTATERGASAGPAPIPERRRKRKRSGSRPGKGLTQTSRIKDEEWTTLPVETLVERRLLGMSLKQLELRCTSNTVHYVLNKEHTEDQLLNSNELKKVLSKTPKFRPTPSTSTSYLELSAMLLRSRFSVMDFCFFLSFLRLPTCMRI